MLISGKDWLGKESLERGFRFYSSSFPNQVLFRRQSPGIFLLSLFSKRREIVDVRREIVDVRREIVDVRREILDVRREILDVRREKILAESKGAFEKTILISLLFILQRRKEMH